MDGRPMAARFACRVSMGYRSAATAKGRAVTFRQWPPADSRPQTPPRSRARAGWPFTPTRRRARRRPADATGGPACRHSRRSPEPRRRQSPWRRRPSRARRASRISKPHGDRHHQLAAQAQIERCHIGMRAGSAGPPRPRAGAGPRGRTGPARRPAPAPRRPSAQGRRPRRGSVRRDGPPHDPNRRTTVPPPWTLIVCPLTQEAAGEQSQSMALAMSCGRPGCPIRLSGCIIRSCISGVIPALA